jgi:PleD family two-component response regulator
METNTESAGILVVEDDPSIAAVLEEILTGKDYSVRVATNPSQALQAVQEKLPELVLMDINLGSDIDGIETVRQLRLKHEDLPVCFITAFSDEETVNRAETVGPIAYLVKPFEMADVLTMVNISLSSSRRMKERLEKAVAQAKPAAAAAPAVSSPVGRADAGPAGPAAEVLEDKLTGLPNRNAVERLMEAWESEDRYFAAVLGMDHVPLLRQRFGGAALERILFSYSQHLGQHLPGYCLLARWDTNTFVVTPKNGASEAEREVLRVVSVPMIYHLRMPGRSAMLRITASLKIVKAKAGGLPWTQQIEAIVDANR